MLLYSFDYLEDLGEGGGCKVICLYKAFNPTVHFFTDFGASRN